MEDIFIRLVVIIFKNKKDLEATQLKWGGEYVVTHNNILSFHSDIVKQNDKPLPLPRSTKLEQDSIHSKRSDEFE